MRRRRSSTRSASPATPMRSATPFRTATRSSSSSASRWPAIRGCCCWTSRPPACRPPRRARPSGCSSASSRERKLTLLFTEHDMDVVFSIAQKIAVLHQGQLIAEGTPGRGAQRSPRCGASIWETALTLLSLHDVHAAYGSSRVLFGISLEVAQGECVCLMGRNGVGKTTTMRAIMGLTPPSAGPRRLEGARHRRLAAVPHRARRHRLRAGGPAHLRRAHGAGEPRRGSACRRAPGTMDDRYGIRAVPEAARAGRPAGRLPVRRRAADADHRPHADGQPRAAAAR